MEQDVIERKSDRAVQSLAGTANLECEKSKKGPNPSG